MKTFEQLDFFEKEQATKLAFYSLVESIVCGATEIEFLHKENQDALARILSTNNERVMTLSILNHNGIRKELESLAIVVAGEQEYDNNGNMKEEKYVDPFYN